MRPEQRGSNRSTMRPRPRQTHRTPLLSPHTSKPHIQSARPMCMSLHACVISSMRVRANMYMEQNRQHRARVYLPL